MIMRTLKGEKSTMLRIVVDGEDNDKDGGNKN